MSSEQQLPSFSSFNAAETANTIKTMLKQLKQQTDELLKQNNVSMQWYCIRKRT